MPVGLRDSRADPGRRGAAVLVGVALLAGLAVAAYVWHGRPQAQTIAPPPVVGGPVWLRLGRGAFRAGRWP